MWRAGHTPFERVGADTFLAVAPWRIVCFSCDADVSMYITQRTHLFPNPTPEIGMLNIFGPSIGGSVGPQHRLYRKVASPAYNEKTHEKIWKFSVLRALETAEQWKASGKVIDVEPSLKRLTLSIMGTGLMAIQYNFSEIPSHNFKSDTHSKPHMMSFQDSLVKVIQNINAICVLPHQLLGKYPLLEALRG